MINAPTCLHIPNLYEDDNALLSWESVDGANGYRLECVFDEGFESASQGLAWGNIQAYGDTWADIKARGLTWEGLSKLPSKGISWNDVMFSGFTWGQIADAGVTWKDIQTMPARFAIYDGYGYKIPGPDMGRSWEDIRDSGITWEELRDKGISWQDISFLPPTTARGLSWDCIKARNISWGDIAARGMTWEEWKSQTDARIHHAHDVKIPRGKKCVYYRVQSHNDTESSDYMASKRITIIPIFYREDIADFSVVKGKRYMIQIYAKGIKSFKGIGMTLEYTPSRLMLDELSYNVQNGQGKSRSMPLMLDIGIPRDGTLIFKCGRTDDDNTKLSAVAAQAIFTATETGGASVKIY